MGLNKVDDYFGKDTELQNYTKTGVKRIKILDWNTAKDKMWNGIGWYGFIGPTTSTTDISLKCLLQTLQYACCLPRSLAITHSNVLVNSALKFDPLLYRILFFAGLIPGDDSRFAIFVGFIKLYSRLDYLYLYYSVYIQALN